MTSGRSVSSWTRVTAARMSAISSASGSPTFTSSMSAPPATCSATSSSSWARSPACSWAWNAFRPVGLMRSPITQNRLPDPMTTVLDRDWRTVSMLNPFGVRRDSEPPAERGDPGVLAEADEVQPAHPRLLQGVAGQLVGDVEAGLLLIRGGLDALDDLSRHRDARHLLVDEAKRPGRAQDRDRRQQRHLGRYADARSLGGKALEQLRLEADLQLQE